MWRYSSCPACRLGGCPGVESFEPVDADYPPAPRLPLLTAAEARDAVGFLQLLESLDVTPRGAAAGQLASELARRLPAE